MRRAWIFVIVIVVLFSICLAVVAVLVWPLAQSPATGAAIGSVSNAVSAVVGFFAAAASAIAAAAAMKAAQQSDETATRAIHALAYATAPKLQMSSGMDSALPDIGGFSGEDRVILLWNSSRWPAANLRVELQSHDGHTDVVELDRLEPSGERKDGWPLDPKSIGFPMRRPDGIDDPAWRGDIQWVDQVVVTYSDERGLIRWRVAFPLEYSVSRDERSTSAGSGPGPGWGKEERVDSGA